LRSSHTALSTVLEGTPTLFVSVPVTRRVPGTRIVAFPVPFTCSDTTLPPRRRLHNPGGDRVRDIARRSSGRTLQHPSPRTAPLCPLCARTRASKSKKAHSCPSQSPEGVDCVFFDARNKEEGKGSFGCDLVGGGLVLSGVRTCRVIGPASQRSTSRLMSGGAMLAAAAAPAAVAVSNRTSGTRSKGGGSGGGGSCAVRPLRRGATSWGSRRLTPLRCAAAFTPVEERDEDQEEPEPEEASVRKQSRKTLSIPLPISPSRHRIVTQT